MASSKDGLTARDVLNLLYPEQPRDPEVRSDANLFAGGVTWIDSEYDQREGEGEGAALSTFQGLLEDGIWYATGYRAGSEERDPIPPDLWTVLDINPHDDSALGGGLEYNGLRFYETKAKPKKTIAGEEPCRKRLVKIMQHRKRKTHNKRNLRTKALVDFKGLSGKGFDRAWDKAVKESTTHRSWHKRGPVARA